MLGPHLSCCSPLPKVQLGLIRASPRLHGHLPTHRHRFYLTLRTPSISPFVPASILHLTYPTAAPTFEATSPQSLPRRGLLARQL